MNHAIHLTLLTLACAEYRTYPVLVLGAPERHPALELTGVALLPDRTLVVSTEGEASALHVVAAPVRTGDNLEIFPLREAEDCGAPRCPDDHRAVVPLRAEPIHWREREPGVAGVRRAEPVPWDIEDLTVFGPDRVLGATTWSAVGRRTGFRRDYVVRSRRQTERLFELQRRDGAWYEVDNPALEGLRAQLSDWGRARCGDDMLVEGLAWDPAAETVFVGLRRCDGPALRVLSWSLGAARQGRAADLELFADGLATGAPGPEEGISALHFAGGRLWALTAWDSYGFAVEPAYGGRLHEVRAGRLHPVDLPGPFVDRPSGLALLDDPPRDAPFEAVDAVVSFDDDGASGGRPDLTLLHARTPRPAEGAFVALLDATPALHDSGLGLNGFDFRWWARDHRLGVLALIPERRPDGEIGAWTRAIGGLWQIRVGGALGVASAALPLPLRAVGHNRQAVALTDLAGAGLTVESWRARLSVVPRERDARSPSVATLLGRAREEGTVILPLPEAAPRAGLVLQGFAIDTAARANRGICLAALDVGVDWANARRSAVAVHAAIIGGICNDFDARGTGLLHGLTSDVTGGVEVVLRFGVVRGAPATPWSVEVSDRVVPGANTGRPEERIRDEMSRAHLHCVTVSPSGEAQHLPRGGARGGDGLRGEPPPDAWLDRAIRATSPPRPGATVLRGFAMAFDLSGFDVPISDLTEIEALGRNQYVYRYLLRVLPTPGGWFVEGGATHGIHRRGPMKDAARPTALQLRADLTTFPGVRAAAWDIPQDTGAADPNLRPEDGVVRWSAVTPAPEEPRCSPSW